MARQYIIMFKKIYAFFPFYENAHSPRLLIRRTQFKFSVLWHAKKMYRHLDFGKTKFCSTNFIRILLRFQFQIQKKDGNNGFCESHAIDSVDYRLFESLSKFSLKKREEHPARKKIEEFPFRRNFLRIS